ncbi:unnamed protein product [Pseudo-nitzschia multistriata]|uniref:Glycosyl transferase family 1 domain-containing protein n=1 Tax=Pseudo-nitzschia multistriata TaxID=183589 RepID=A0A448ZJU4_9STRA|nr:unnamed protein product [Pseudo-nitzschia multistriata]
MRMIDSFATDDDETINHHGGNQEQKIWKICILCEPPPITYRSGQAARFRLLMKHLSDHHHNTHKLQLVTADAVSASPPLHCFNGKIPIHYTLGFCPRQYKTMTLSCDASLKSLRVLFPSQQKFDLIHVSSPGLLLFPAILASQLYQIPLLMSYHTHLPIYARSYLPRPFNALGEILAWFGLIIVHFFADLTLVTSPQIEDEFRARYSTMRFMLPSSINNMSLLVWKKGVDTTAFHPIHRDREMRERMIGTHGNPDDFLIVHVGRLAKEKRLKDLRGVLEEINTRRNWNRNRTCPTIRLCIVGSGPEEEELRRYFEGTPTVFLGRLDGKELGQAFASGDVFCMPSDSETLGFVVLESMASGVPCVAARAGGPIDLIEDNVTGYLVPTGDVSAFADRIEAMMNDQELRRRLSLAARKEMERWSWYASMEQIRDQAYPKCVENFRSRRLSQRLYHRFMGQAKKPKTS